MSKIISVGTAVPRYRHEQHKLFEFMSRVYALNETDKRKLGFVYRHSGINSRYSVLPDFSLRTDQWQFFPPNEGLEPFPSMETRMASFQEHSVPLSLSAITDCLQGHRDLAITHLITVSCTGMSAPGLDLQLVELLGLPAHTSRTSVNFMGCYAAIHALKMADAICKANGDANVLIVCVELCTLHLQKNYTPDNISSSILFGDGAAAVLVTGSQQADGMHIDHLYSSVCFKGKQEMAWELSSTGFTLKLSGFIPDLIEHDFSSFVGDALSGTGLDREDVTDWCIHPGGRKILEAVHKSLGLLPERLQHSYDVLRDYGNMSSCTVLFVLKRIMRSLDRNRHKNVFGAAFGPGLTLESFVLSA